MFIELKNRETGVRVAAVYIAAAETDARARPLAVRHARNFMDVPHEALAASDGVPVVERLEERILEVLESGGRLDMDAWHGGLNVGRDADLHADGCNTTHCLAGWAIHLAGEAGYELERVLDSPVDAGDLIWRASTGEVPNFYDDDVEALEWLRERVRRRTAEGK